MIRLVDTMKKGEDSMILALIATLCLYSTVFTFEPLNP